LKHCICNSGKYWRKKRLGKFFPLIQKKSSL
jgi:hypothetical protein